MIKKILLATALLLAACNNHKTGGVMDEIQRAEAQDAATATASNAAAAAPESGPAGPAQALPSGVSIQFTHHSSNASLPRPTMNAQVLVHYEGKLVSNGQVFNSSFERGQPVPFPLRAVVPGFAEALTHMRPGDELIATIPAALGYGAEGSPPVIPPNADLRFRIQLLAFQEPNGQVVEAPH